MCWKEACTTLSAELGKRDFLFPQKRSYIRLWTNEKETAGAPHHCRTPAWTLGRSFPCSWALVSHFLTLSPHIAPASLPTPRFPAPCAKSQPRLVPAPAAGAQAAKRKGCCSSQPRDSPQEEARLLGKSGHFCWTLGRELIFFPPGSLPFDSLLLPGASRHIGLRAQAWMSTWNSGDRRPHPLPPRPPLPLALSYPEDTP